MPDFIELQVNAGIRFFNLSKKLFNILNSTHINNNFLFSIKISIAADIHSILHTVDGLNRVNRGNY